MTQWVGSPNFTTGRESQPVQFIVVHHMAGTIAATDSVFQDRARNTSAHYGVGRGGSIHQYVDEANTAYHAGNWDANTKSIGIEHEDLNADNYTDQLYATSAQLIQDIGKRYGFQINSNTVRRHRDFSATACPGTLDVDRLIREANVSQKDEGDVVGVNELNNIWVGCLFRDQQPYDVVNKVWRDEGPKGFLGQPMNVVLQFVLESPERKAVEAIYARGEKVNSSNVHITTKEEVEDYIKKNLS